MSDLSDLPSHRGLPLARRDRQPARQRSRGGSPGQALARQPSRYRREILAQGGECGGRILPPQQTEPSGAALRLVDREMSADFADPCRLSARLASLDASLLLAWRHRKQPNVRRSRRDRAALERFRHVELIAAILAVDLPVDISGALHLDQDMEVGVRAPPRLAPSRRDRRHRHVQHTRHR